MSSWSDRLHAAEPAPRNWTLTDELQA